MTTIRGSVNLKSFNDITELTINKYNFDKINLLSNFTK